HHEGGKVLGIAAETVRDPGSRAREPKGAKSTVGLVGCRRMVASTGPHRPDARKLVRHFGDVRKQVGNPEAAAASLAERPVRAMQETDLAEEGVRILARGHGFAVVGRQLRFVIERVDLTEAALQEDLNYVLCSGTIMRPD